MLSMIGKSWLGMGLTVSGHVGLPMQKIGAPHVFKLVRRRDIFRGAPGRVSREVDPGTPMDPEDVLLLVKGRIMDREISQEPLLFHGQPPA